ncbi:MAG: HD domain-containing protein [Candidatus Moraniibacteriota bacterium]
MIEVKKIISKYYKPGTKIYKMFVVHGKVVAKKSLAIAKKFKNKKIDLEFLEEAALLHDIGMFLTNEPNLNCFGRELYIKHGALGRELLEKEGLPEHALVCERHVGVGITKENIINEKLPLPKRDMSPKTLEEKIICLADNFFSKDGKYVTKEKPLGLIKEIYAKLSPEHVKKLEKLYQELILDPKDKI